MISANTSDLLLKFFNLFPPSFYVGTPKLLIFQNIGKTVDCFHDREELVQFEFLTMLEYLILW